MYRSYFLYICCAGLSFSFHFLFWLKVRKKGNIWYMNHSHVVCYHIFAVVWSMILTCFLFESNNVHYKLHLSFRRVPKNNNIIVHYKLHLTCVVPRINANIFGVHNKKANKKTSWMGMLLCHKYHNIIALMFLFQAKPYLPKVYCYTMASTKRCKIFIRQKKSKVLEGFWNNMKETFGASLNQLENCESP